MCAISINILTFQNLEQSTEYNTIYFLCKHIIINIDNKAKTILFTKLI